MLSRDGLVFSNRMNGDQLVNKGAVRVQLRVPDSGLVFNVVGTHMQSTDSALQVSAMYFVADAASLVVVGGGVVVVSPPSQLTKVA